MKKVVSLVMCIVMLTLAFGNSAVFAASGDENTPYSLYIGSPRLTFDGWGIFPQRPIQNDFIEQKIYKELGINMIRVGLYSDYENGRTDVTSPDFQEFIMKVRQAKEHNLDYMISIWSPPAVMKTNGRRDGYETLNADGTGTGTASLISGKEDEFYDYVVQALDYLRDNALPLPLAFGFANEPNNAQSYESCVYEKSQMETLMKGFNRAFEENGYGDILMCTPEQVTYSLNNLTFGDSNELLSDSEYSAAYDVLAFHGYGWRSSNKNPAPIVKRSDIEGKEIWATESCKSVNLYGDTAEKDENGNTLTVRESSTGYKGVSELARTINFHTQIYGANRWIYWNGYVNTGNLASALAVETADGELVMMPGYYFMKALFNNVPAGSQVAWVNTNDPAYTSYTSYPSYYTDLAYSYRNMDYLDIGGYKTEDGEVFVIYNSGGSTKYYKPTKLCGDSILLYRFGSNGNVKHESPALSGGSCEKFGVAPGETVIFVSGKALTFGDDVEIGDDNEKKEIRARFVKETAPPTGTNYNIGTIWGEDGRASAWKTSKPGFVGVRQDEQGFGEEFICIKGQSGSGFAYTTPNPTLSEDKNWSIRATLDLSQCSWQNTYGSNDTYTTLFSSAYQPFNGLKADPAANDAALKNAFAVVVTKSGMLRIAGGENGAYCVYMADEARLDASGFDPLGVHTYTIDKTGSDIEITIDGTRLGRLIKMAHISNLDIGFGNTAVVDIPGWGDAVTVKDKDGADKTVTADLDLSIYSPTIKYAAAANQITVDQNAYSGSWQTTTYPGMKDIQLVLDRAAHRLGEIGGAEVETGDDISMLFKVEKSILNNPEVDSYTVKITNGETTETYFNDKAEPSEDMEGYYSFAFSNINPSGTDSAVTAMLTLNLGGYTESHTYTSRIKDWCYERLADSESTQRQRAIIEELLRYGAAVQSYAAPWLGGNELADYRLADKTVSVPQCSDIFAVGKDLPNPSVVWRSARAVLGSSVDMRLFMDIGGYALEEITAEVSINGAPSFKISGKEIKTENGQCYIDVPDISLRMLEAPIKVQIKQGDTPISNTLTYSVGSYAAYHQEVGGSFGKAVNALINLGRAVSGNV